MWIIKQLKKKSMQVYTMRGLIEECTFSYHVHHIVITVHTLLYVLTDADSIMDETFALSLF